VFLLAGVGAILSVLATRLARIVDRGRVLHDRLQRDAQERAEIEAELAVIKRRMLVVNIAITLCTICALLICAVVAVLFLGTVTANDPATPIAFLFVSAMACLIIALLAFLLEIYLATVKMPLRR
jgi:Na+/melibiose symporter-like transporter